MRSASMMTDFAWRFRYPGSLEMISLTDAVKAIQLAERVLSAAEAVLPETCRSPS